MINTGTALLDNPCCFRYLAVWFDLLDHCSSLLRSRVVFDFDKWKKVICISFANASIDSWRFHH